MTLSSQLTARQHATKKVSKGTQALRSRFHALTAQIRLIPDFIIIGAQKCGTSSLYTYLAQHPNVSPALVKEVHYFDHNFSKGINWYRTHFPSVLYKSYVKAARGRDLMIGEASPSYLAHPEVPGRLFEVIPQVKLILLLRNPVDRAYSHYHHRLRNNRETLPFEEVVEADKELLREGWDQPGKNGGQATIQKIYYSYLQRGIYVDQIKRWLGVFPKEQFLFLKSEDFFADPATGFDQVLDFLDLPFQALETYKQYYAGSYHKMKETTRQDLVDYFRPHNQRLGELLGMDFGWDQ